MKYIKLILSLTVFLSLNIFSQSSNINKRQWFEYASFRVNCIAYFDNEILVGSTEGVYAVDPYNYAQTKKYIIDNENVVDFYYSGKSRLWCLTSNKLYLLENQRIREYPLPNYSTNLNGAFNQVCERRDGVLFIGTQNGYFKGDSNSLSFCDSRQFASENCGVKEILSDSDGRVYMQFSRDGRIRNGDSGDFLLIDEFNDPKNLLLINRVGLFNFDGKGNLHIIVSKNNNLSFSTNNEIFEGKKIKIVSTKAKFLENEAVPSTYLGAMVLSPKFDLISSEQFANWNQTVTLQRKSNGDVINQIVDMYCGILSELSTAVVYDDRERKWGCTDAPIITVESPGFKKTISLVTKNPYNFWKASQIKESNQCQVVKNHDGVFFASHRFLGKKLKDSWILNDILPIGPCNRLVNTPTGKSFVDCSSNCNPSYFDGNKILILDRDIPTNWIGHTGAISTFDRNGKLFSLGVDEQPQTHFGPREARELEFKSFNDGDWQQESTLYSNGAILFYGEVFDKIQIVATDKFVHAYKDGYWNHIINEYDEGFGKILGVVGIVDSIFIIATEKGLLKLDAELKITKIKYPNSLRNINAVNLMKFDVDSSLWISFDSKLFQYKDSKWKDHTNQVKLDCFKCPMTPFDHNNGTLPPDYVSFVSDRKNGTFLSTGAGTYQYYSGSWRMISPIVYGDLCFDEEGNLMIFHSKGVALYNLKGVRL